MPPSPRCSEPATRLLLLHGPYPGLGDTYAGSADALRELLDRFGAARVHAFGVSLGGHRTFNRYCDGGRVEGVPDVIPAA